ncbi:MAG: 16S rRNA (cytosine(1402)-N(4))-methyltransferase RsmH [Patescibacteria group bacterium]
MSKHAPVLLQEVIEYLRIAPGSVIVDATLNGAGHTKAILEQFPDVRVVGIEWDPELYRSGKEALTSYGDRAVVVNDTYTNLSTIVAAQGVVPDGVLFDLGLSSWHYETSGRGFSFQHDEPLDMRFHPESGKQTAAELVNTATERELVKILQEFGEEQFAEQIARAMVEERHQAPITTTEHLVRVIGQAVPEWYKHRKIHYATKTFQALRVAVNDELSNVRRGVQAAIDAVKPGGRVVVISFQGMEDKAVREVFKENVARGVIKWVTKDTIRPRWAEIEKNPRARSAKMKIAERLDVSL